MPTMQEMVTRLQLSDLVLQKALELERLAKVRWLHPLKIDGVIERSCVDMAHSCSLLFLDFHVTRMTTSRQPKSIAGDLHVGVQSTTEC